LGRSVLRPYEIVAGIVVVDIVAGIVVVDRTI
jgi:hypothetical protein